MTLEAERTRTISWEDPALAVEASRTMSGLDFLHAMLKGRLPRPPIMQLMAIELVEFDEGRAVFAVEPAECHYNPIGVVHGGLACTILDSAMGCAVHTTLPRGTGYTTLELKVNLLRPLTLETGRLLCEGKSIHTGRRVATAEGRLIDGAGRLYAHGTTTCMVFRETSADGRQ